VSAIPTFMVSRLASEQVKVVLSGDGGDELFAGYDRYVVEARERRLDRIPGAIKAALGWISRRVPEGVRGKNLLRHWSLRRGRRYLDAATLFRREQQERLFTADVRRTLFDRDPHGHAMRLLDADGHWLSRLQTLDVNRYLPLDILTKVDRMSMAHSIEARVPLLDHKFMEFAATIPPEMTLRGTTTKHVFREAMRPLLPPGVLERPKRGFAVPLQRWFRGQLGEFVRAVLLSETTRRRGVFDPTYLQRVLTWHENGRALDLHLWTMISFELWCRVFLDAPVATTRRPGVSTVFAPGTFEPGLAGRIASGSRAAHGRVAPVRVPDGR
jgi:asparagine synthase (glutamine-hydrolysing)